MAEEFSKEERFRNYEFRVGMKIKLSIIIKVSVFLIL